MVGKLLFFTPGFFKPAFLITFFIQTHLLRLAITVCTSFMLVLLTYIILYMLVKSYWEKNYAKWRQISGLLIRKAIFYDDEDFQSETQIPVTKRAGKLMEKKRFRNLLVEELLIAKKNISGTSAEYLQRLYQQLELDKYALQRLKSYHWYKKAKAIQELSIMDMKQYLTKIYRFTNDKNEFVRMEAQSAIVEFYGFEGLRFLDVVSYPISEWQQIKLLQELSRVPVTNFSINSWLKSSNYSVAVFALKLARNYHRFELHDLVLTCLDHPNSVVRLQAINCLSEIYTDETSRYLIDRYWKEDYKQQLTIVKALQSIGTDLDIPFLLSVLTSDNNELKIAAARSLAHLSKTGYSILQDSINAENYPLNEIILQIKGEIAA